MMAVPRILLVLAAAAAVAGCAGAPREAPAVRAEIGPDGRGLWIGPVRLCRETVENALSIRDPDGSRALLVTLKAAARDEFARATAASVGAKMPIRLDGRILSEPIINEPILGGMAQISGLSGDVEAAALAAKAPC